MKRVKLEPPINVILKANKASHQLVIKNAGIDHVTRTSHIKIENHNSDSNDSSDSERLQMDISDENLENIKKNNNRSKHIFVDRETPDSMASDEHHEGTDPATTQLWQALAQYQNTQGRLLNFLFL